MTAASSSSFWSRGTRVLSALLVLVVGLQTLPLQSLVHHARTASTHHECTHPKGYCPMNPDGPCRCDHDTSTSDEPTFRPCSGGSTNGLPPAVSGKWVFVPSSQLPSPSVTPTPVRAAWPDRLSSQRAGDDIFRPPRTQPPVRRA